MGDKAYFVGLPPLVTDMMDGNIQNGMVRAMNGLMISFAIAMGIFSVKMILNFIQ